LGGEESSDSESGSAELESVSGFGFVPMPGLDFRLAKELLDTADFDLPMVWVQLCLRSFRRSSAEFNGAHDLALLNLAVERALDRALLEERFFERHFF